jgi:hypothetical protein
MSLIKFPSQIKPSKVDVQLQRVDQIIASPLTNIYQVAARGNPAWKWSFAFADLSDSEREIVQAFLMKCKGSVNTFKVGDPGDYAIRGSVSNWVDLFGGRGSFQPAEVGSDTDAVNSYFVHSTNMTHHVADDGMLRFEIRNRGGALNLGWKGHGTDYLVNSLEVGRAYVQRVKFFPQPGRDSIDVSFQVGSGSNANINQITTPLKSEDSLTAPFYVGNEITNLKVGIYDWVIAQSGTLIGDYYNYADYKLSRCALVVNSENLITRSNQFDHADWTATRVDVNSGGVQSPDGRSNYGWQFDVNTTQSGVHSLLIGFTQVNTRDVYTASGYFRTAEYSEIELQIDHGSDTDSASALFWLNSGTYSNVAVAGAYQRPRAEIFDVGSGWMRCSITAAVSSNNVHRWKASIASGTSTSFAGTAGSGVEIYGAQISRFPFMGPYNPSSNTAVVGSNYQTGSNVIATGFDPGDIIKAGTRIEIVNQYNDAANNKYERSEFKRITEEVVAHREGWAILPIEPPIRNAPIPMKSDASGSHAGDTLHNAIIFHKPEMKGRLMSGSISYSDKPLKMTDFTFEVIEDMTE